MSGFIKYRSYSFKDKDPIIDKVRTMVKDEKVSVQATSDLSGVSVGTIHNWFSGNTRRPQHATVMAVIRGLGYDLVVRRLK